MAFQSQDVEIFNTDAGIYNTISLLAKRLSQTTSSRITQFQLYEKLLTYRDGPKIQEVTVEQENLNELFEKLSASSLGENIIQFLLQFYVEKKEKTNESENFKETEITKMFSCPKGMLDGSLFELKLPTVDLNLQIFDELPENEIYSMHKFKEKETKLEKAKEATDEEEEERIEYTAEMFEPIKTCRNWECLGHLEALKEKPLFTEIVLDNKTFFRDDIVSLKELQQHVSFLIVGVPSKSFIYNEDKFVLRNGLATEDANSYILQNSFTEILIFAGYYKKIEIFLLQPPQDFLLEILQENIHTFLSIFNDISSIIQTKKFTGVFHLINFVKYSIEPLRVLYNICIIASRCENSTVLLNQITKLSANYSTDYRANATLRSFIRKLFTAYFRYISAWLFEGIIEREFFIHADINTIHKKSRKFWTEGFKLKPKKIPNFLSEVINDFVLCGKGVYLLKLCNKQHPLLNELSLKRPELSIFKPYEKLESEWEEYYKIGIDVIGPLSDFDIWFKPPIEQLKAAAAERERKWEIWKLEVKAAKEAAELERRLVKQKLYEEWKKQIDEKKLRNEEIRKKEEEIEQKLRIIRDSEQEHHEKLLEIERANLRAHYRALETAAEEKLKATSKQIELLQSEFNSDVNSNPINCTTDTNANLTDEAIKTENIKNNSEQTNTIAAYHHSKSSVADTFLGKNVKESENITAAYHHSKSSVGELFKNKQIQESAENITAAYHHHRSSVADTFRGENIKEPINTTAAYHHSKSSVADTFRGENIKESTNTTAAYHHYGKSSVGELFKNDLIENTDINDPMTASVDSILSENRVMTVSMDSIPSENRFMTLSVDSILSDNRGMTDSALSENKMMSASIDSYDSKITELDSKMINNMAKTISTYSFISGKFSEPFERTIRKPIEKINYSEDISQNIVSSISTALRIQLKLVNHSIFKLFFEEEKFLEHVQSIMNYLLHFDGEFSRRFTEGLCLLLREKNSTNRRLPPILGYAISNSMFAAKDPNSQNLYIELKADQKALIEINSIKLDYKVPWPVNIIITNEALLHYNRIFDFIMLIREAVWSVDESFRWLQNTRREISRKSYDYFQIRIMRHEMSHFVHALHDYIMNSAVLRSWNNFQNNILKNTNTLDDLYKKHTAFVKGVIFYCLLRVEAQVVQKIFHVVLKHTVHFYSLLVSYDFVSHNNSFIHPAMEQITKLFNKFKDRRDILLRNLFKIAESNHQHELFEFLDALNIGNYYPLKI